MCGLNFLSLKNNSFLLNTIDDPIKTQPTPYTQLLYTFSINLASARRF